MMMKEIKELKKRRDVPYSEIGRLSVVNMLVLPKFTNRVKQFPSKHYLMK